MNSKLLEATKVEEEAKLLPEVSDMELLEKLAEIVPVTWHAALKQRMVNMSNSLECLQSEFAQVDQKANDLQFRVDRWNKIAEGSDPTDTCGGNRTHERVAAEVYCLQRDSLDFMGVIQMARDRILWLTQHLYRANGERDRLRTDNVELRRQIKKLEARKTVY